MAAAVFILIPRNGSLEVRPTDFSSTIDAPKHVHSSHKIVRILPHSGESGGQPSNVLNDLLIPDHCPKHKL